MQSISLNDIPAIALSLKCASTHSVKLLNEIVSDEPFDRSTRKRLRQFSSFPDTFDITKQKQKLLKSFSLANFISVCNLLNIDCSGNEETLCDKIFQSLSDLNSFQNSIEYFSSDDNEDEATENIPNQNAEIPVAFGFDSTATQILHAPGANVVGELRREINKNKINQQCAYPDTLATNKFENHSFLFLLREICEITRSFSGKDSYSIHNFLFDLEELFSIYCFTEDVHKILITKKLLANPARIFVLSLKNITCFDILKEHLLAEFGTKNSSIEVHKLLNSRKLKQNETVTEYFISMRALASEGNIDDDSLIEYCIAGLPDSQAKLILYGCRNIFEFKQKLRSFEKLYFSDVKSDTHFHRSFKQNNHLNRNFSRDNRKNFTEEKNNRNNFVEPKFQPSSGPSPSRFPKTTEKLCFNCGERNHISNFCPNKSKGIKCFECKQFGSHKAANCPSKNVQSHVAINHAPNSTSLFTKTVTINENPISAVVDTASNKTLLKEEYFHKVAPNCFLDESKVQLHGLGNTTVTPLGSFKTSIFIDGFEFRTDICIIPNNALQFPMLVGADVLSQGNLNISHGVVSLTKINTLIITSSSTHDTEQTGITPTADALQHSTMCTKENFINSEYLFAHLIDSVETTPYDLNHTLDSSLKSQLSTLINNYKPLQTKQTNLQMTLILTDDIPIAQRPRRLPLAEQKIVETQIQDWLKEGIIQHSCSDYASPIVLCKKKNGSYRLCIDYRRLNKKIIRDKYPIPLIDEVLDKLQQAKVFSSLDLKNGFFHVPMNPNSTKYTSFVTHEGQYEFLKVPFGLSNSPSVFQRFVSTVFRDLIRENVIVIYMDDLVIPSQDENEGLLKLKRVLEVASDFGLILNLKKCQFLQRRIDFLGYVIENGTIKPSPAKTLAVQNFPLPKTCKQVQSFLGLTGYFRKFIKNYSLIARPLSDLLKKDASFHFGPEQHQAFLALKHSLSNQPVLHIFDQNSPLQLHTDASSFGFGAVLLQKSSDDDQWHPIHYMSRKTSPQQSKYSSYELEALAVIEAVKKFRNYLLGTKFKIVTDCAAFQQTLQKRDLTPKIARWAMYLNEFDFEIIHRPGKYLQHVDALSRNSVYLTTSLDPNLTLQLSKAQSEDEYIKTLKILIQTGQDSEHILKNNIVYKIEKDRELIVVPQMMQTDIIRSIHNKGHFAVAKTLEILNQDFYIAQARRQIENIITNCVECILCNKKRGKKEGLLHSIPKGDIPLSTYHIDFLGPLPSTNKQYQYIFSVVDAFSKFTWLYPVKSTTSRDALDKLKLQSITFGNPSRILSDRGSAFTSQDFAEYCVQENIDHVVITTGIPRGNGQVERIQGILLPVLAKLSIDDPAKWFKFVPDVQRILNSTTSTTTNFTPFELMIGIKMKNKEDLRVKQILDEENLNIIMQEKHNLRDVAKRNILDHQRRSQIQYNKHRKQPNNYKVGDAVAIQKTQFSTGSKLHPKFYGPYEVTAVKNHDRYEVKKIGQHAGPNTTSTAADHMKPWPHISPHYNT